jgi:hypothetical protein
MRGLVPRIHVFAVAKAWMAGPSPAMTSSTKSEKCSKSRGYGGKIMPVWLLIRP